MTAPVSRRPRSDGERSRQAILATAARLASTHGIERLSIGDLATEVGMSKSGLYAHFGSKEELQLATIDAAEDIFNEVVIEPAASAPPGLPSVLALSDAFIDHLRDKVFPGGCACHATWAGRSSATTLAKRSWARAVVRSGRAPF